MHAWSMCLLWNTASLPFQNTWALCLSDLSAYRSHRGSLQSKPHLDGWGQGAWGVDGVPACQGLMESVFNNSVERLSSQVHAFFVMHSQSGMGNAESARAASQQDQRITCSNAAVDSSIFPSWAKAIAILLFVSAALSVSSPPQSTWIWKKRWCNKLKSSQDACRSSFNARLDVYVFYVFGRICSAAVASSVQLLGRSCWSLSVACVCVCVCVHFLNATALAASGRRNEPLPWAHECCCLNTCMALFCSSFKMQWEDGFLWAQSLCCKKVYNRFGVVWCEAFLTW